MPVKIIKKGKFKGVKIKTNKKGYLINVTNPKGYKKSVTLVQVGDRPGFTAVSSKTFRPIKNVKSSRSETVLAERLIKRGHKKIEFR